MAAKKKTAAPKRGASRHQPSAKKSVRGWMWPLSGLLVGGFIVLLMQLQPGREGIQREKPGQATADGKHQLEKSEPKQTQQQKPKYDFYTLLPESKGMPPIPAQPPPPRKPVSAKEAARIDAARAEALLNGRTPSPAAVIAKAPTVTEYFLQAGAFRKREEAEKVRAQIILLGQNVRIESGTVRDEVWHRVVVGPFSNREQFASAQKSLAANGFGNLLLQQRQKL